MRNLYALGFALLAMWGIFTASQAFKAHGRWASRRWQILLVDILFGGSCLLCAAGLWLSRFRAWMLVPVGLSFLLMIPLPCYFRGVDQNRALHHLRTLLFVVVAALCFSLALGLLALSFFGL